MKAVRLQSYGDVDQFRLEEAPDPVQGPGEVLVRVAFAGLNPVDAFVRQGGFKKLQLEMPAILGIDASGTVEAVGKGVTGYNVGDRVAVHAPLKGHGTYAEKVVAPLAGLAHLPEGADFRLGAALPLVGLTGRQLVDRLGGVRAGQRVLVSGALGGVGRAAVQYLRELGAVPVAGVRAERLDEGREVAGEALDIGAAGAPEFDLAVSAAAPVAGRVVARVRDGGLVASSVQVPEEAKAGGRVRVENIMAKDDPAMLQAVADAAGRGELVLPVARVFPLAELAEAHRILGRGPQGKILIEV
ncbi:Alcohol dehydrogenase, zinc-binding protein domain protein [Rubellimicrobium mesophilum DSM 19309]|uniref:Alcohol dehydrogenase, zinc-binding protein domain protein n=1 Tax=Rubellimicrobium mesophilum DSM 19309 TaxID=442562 RepID=A0A017HJ89_9RHOB|nr:NADP-dependent oxidoreductase [Rubellimicrobium mesophilum]EYD73859.1 Alcohol dehydrogenase, zinc-binding protein domain protein [Rubellimicrobium mesophilum DSM 19309]